MKIAVLHSGNLGFFPGFYHNLLSSVIRHGDEIMAFAPRTGQNIRRPLERQILWGYRWNWHVHFRMYKLTGLQDIWSPLSTRDLIRKLKEYCPDIVHLNVVNQWDTSFPLLIRYLNKTGIPVVWTFHDSRAFTGKCAYFDDINCYRWQIGCGHCPKDVVFPSSLVDNTRLEWKLRNKWFNRIERLYIVTPSEWLAGLVRQSFLKDKPIVVINNGIDTISFSQPANAYIPLLEEIKEKIVLGVASGWEHRKGLGTMIWLSEHLPDDYKVVLVGLKPEQKQTLPKSIVGIQRTNSKTELIAIYQRAAVFVNPTSADNFPTVNIEALGAGLPVVTFKTGGSAECLAEGCGMSVKKGDNEGLLMAVIEVASHPEIFSRENCIRRSRDFSLIQYDKYVEYYHHILGK